MKNFFMLYAAISMSLCGMTPLQAADTADLEQAVVRQVAIQQPLKSQESDRFARKMVYNLLKAHNGNVAEALEDFAGAPIFANYSYPQIHAIYMSPEDLNTLWVVYTAFHVSSSRWDYSHYDLMSGKIERGGKGIHHITGYSLKNKALLFTDRESKTGHWTNDHQQVINRWWEHKDDCPMANIGAFIAWDMEPGSTLFEMKEKFDDFAACNPDSFYSVYVDQTDYQHVYVITGNDYQVRMTDYYVGDATRGGQHMYLESKNPNDPNWKEKAIEKLAIQAFYKGCRGIWDYRE